MVESYEEILLRIEGELLGRPAVNGWLRALDSLLGAGADLPALRAALGKVAPPEIRGALQAAISDATSAAIGQSARLIHPAYGADGSAAASLVDAASSTFRISPELAAVVRDFDQEARIALSKARIVAASGGDADAVLAEIRAQKAKTHRAVTRVVNQSANEATRHTASAAGLPVVWVAERNACVRCLAYQGTVAKDGAPFPGGLTYAPEGAAHPALHTPPLHPHCRCHLEALKDQSYADALRREADRSVLRGFALPSESRATRVAAARKLIDDGVVAPKSVIKFAERSIKKGNFGTPLRTPGGPAHSFTGDGPATPPPTPPRSPKTPPPPPPAPKKPAPKATPPTPPPAAPKKSPSSPPKVTPPAAPKAVIPPISPPAPPKKSPSSPPKVTPTGPTTAERTAKLRKELADVKAQRAALAKQLADVKAAAALPAKASGRIQGSTTAAEAASHFTAAHGARTVLIGFDRRGLNLGNAKDALATLSDLLDDFPNAKLASVSIERLPKNVLAAVFTPRGRGGTYETPYMKIAPGYITGDGSTLKKAIADSNDGGHFHNADAEHGLIHTITHEFGHVLDSNLNHAGRKATTSAKTKAKNAFKKANPDDHWAKIDDWTDANLSGYAKTSPGEHFAEAFADGRILKDKALPLSIEIHAEALRLAKDANL